MICILCAGNHHPRDCSAESLFGVSLREQVTEKQRAQRMAEYRRLSIRYSFDRSQEIEPLKKAI